MTRRFRQSIGFGTSSSAEADPVPQEEQTPTSGAPGEPQPQPGPAADAPGMPQAEESRLPPAGPPAAAPVDQPADTVQEGNRTSPFVDMLKREYEAELDKQISAAVNKVSARFGMLLSQERNPGDVAKDSLGNRSDYYENLVTSVQQGDPRIGKTKEEVYQYLAKNLPFTEMRNIEAIKQEFQQG